MMENETKRMQALRKSGLIGCLNDSGVTSQNREIIREMLKDAPVIKDKIELFDIGNFEE